MKIREACKKLTTAAKRSANCQFPSPWGKVSFSRVFIYCLFNVAMSKSWTCVSRWMGHVTVTDAGGSSGVQSCTGRALGWDRCWVFCLSVLWGCVGVGGCPQGLQWGVREEPGAQACGGNV